jgi:hypothetical protein
MHLSKARKEAISQAVLALKVNTRADIQASAKGEESMVFWTKAYHAELAIEAFMGDTDARDCLIMEAERESGHSAKRWVHVAQYSGLKGWN